MSLQTRLAALITAVGADIKDLKSPKPYCRVRSTANVSWPQTAIGQIATPFTFGAAPAVTQVGTDVTWDQANQWIEINRTGLYLVGFEMFWVAAAAEQVRSAVLTRNGSVRHCEDRNSFANGVAPWLSGCDIFPMSSGDFLQLCPGQNSATAQNIGFSTSDATKMYAAYLGPIT